MAAWSFSAGVIVFLLYLLSMEVVLLGTFVDKSFIKRVFYLLSVVGLVVGYFVSQNENEEVFLEFSSSFSSSSLSTP